MLFDGPIPRQTNNLQQNELQVVGEVNPSRPQTLLHLSSGEVIVVSTELLLSGQGQRTGATATPFTAQAPGSSAGARDTFTNQNEVVIPLVAEESQFGKQSVVTGKVRLHRGTETFTQTVGLPLTRRSWDVERVPVGQLYEERPEIRQEGDMTIYPLVEERLVAKREYLLVEEVRVRQVEVTTEGTATAELQRDVLSVDRQSV